MSRSTKNLNLYEKIVATDGNDSFNIQTMLNDNWDKIDDYCGELDTKIDNIKIGYTDVKELKLTDDANIDEIFDAMGNGSFANLAILAKKANGYPGIENQEESSLVIFKNKNGESMSILSFDKDSEKSSVYITRRTSGRTMPWIKIPDEADIKSLIHGDLKTRSEVLSNRLEILELKDQAFLDGKTGIGFYDTYQTNEFIKNYDENILLDTDVSLGVITGGGVGSYKSKGKIYMVGKEEGARYELNISNLTKVIKANTKYTLFIKNYRSNSLEGDLFFEAGKPFQAEQNITIAGQDKSVVKILATTVSSPEVISILARESEKYIEFTDILMYEGDVSYEDISDGIKFEKGQIDFSTTGGRYIVEPQNFEGTVKKTDILLQTDETYKMDVVENSNNSSSLSIEGKITLKEGMSVSKGKNEDVYRINSVTEETELHDKKYIGDNMINNVPYENEPHTFMPQYVPHRGTTMIFEGNRYDLTFEPAGGYNVTVRLFKTSSDVDVEICNFTVDYRYNQAHQMVNFMGELYIFGIETLKTNRYNRIFYTKPNLSKEETNITNDWNYFNTGSIVRYSERMDCSDIKVVPNDGYIEIVASLIHDTSKCGSIYNRAIPTEDGFRSTLYYYSDYSSQVDLTRGDNTDSYIYFGRNNGQCSIYKLTKESSVFESCLLRTMGAIPEAYKVLPSLAYYDSYIYVLRDRDKSVSSYEMINNTHYYYEIHRIHCENKSIEYLETFVPSRNPYYDGYSENCIQRKAFLHSHVDGVGLLYKSFPIGYENQGLDLKNSPDKYDIRKPSYNYIKTGSDGLFDSIRLDNNSHYSSILRRNGSVIDEDPNCVKINYGGHYIRKYFLNGNYLVKNNTSTIIEFETKISEGVEELAILEVNLFTKFLNLKYSINSMTADSRTMDKKITHNFADWTNVKLIIQPNLSWELYLNDKKVMYDNDMASKTASGERKDFISWGNTASGIINHIRNISWSRNNSQVAVDKYQVCACQIKEPACDMKTVIPAYQYVGSGKDIFLASYVNISSSGRKDFKCSIMNEFGYYVLFYNSERYSTYYGYDVTLDVTDFDRIDFVGFRTNEDVSSMSGMKSFKAEESSTYTHDKKYNVIKCTRPNGTIQYKRLFNTYKIGQYITGNKNLCQLNGQISVDKGDKVLLNPYVTKLNGEEALCKKIGLDGKYENIIEKEVDGEVKITIDSNNTKIKNLAYAVEV